MEVAVCGEVVSFDFPIVEGTLYLAVGNGGCITPGMTLDCDFLRRFFNPKNFANFASEIDPASFEVRLEPSFREADTLWKSSGFILNPKSEKCR